jgi:hypothetical protein
VSSEQAWKALQQVNDWIKVADAKATALLAASGVLGGLLAKSAPTPADFRTRPLVAALLATSLICVGFAVLVTLRTLAPRLRTGEPRSLLYFDHVGRRYARSLDKFADNFSQLLDHESDYRRHVIEQIWANSKVARGKFRRVAFATYALGGAMAFTGAALVVERMQQH